MAWRIFGAMVAAASLASGPACGGAWPREMGGWYASAAVHLGWSQDIATWVSYAPAGRYDALYVEYGATDRLTIGVDLGRSVSGGGKTIAFAQYPVLPAAYAVKAAAQLGFGSIDGVQVVRPGLLLGYGRPGGWLAADLLVEQPITFGPGDVKLDLTWGMNLARGRKLILQAQTGRQAGDPAFARVAPSLVVPLRGPLSAEIGGAWGVVGDDSMGLKLGVWVEF